MTDNEAAREVGFDDASLAFMGNDSGQPDSVDTGDASDPAAVSNDDDTSQTFFPSTSSWDFQGSPTYQSYGVSSSAASATQPAYVDSSWQLPLFNQQQPGPSGPDDFTQSEMNSGPLFGFNSYMSGQPGGSSSKKPQLPTIATLTPELHEKLRNIAMPSHRRYTSTRSASSFGSADGEHKGGALSSPDDRSDSRKRKVSAELDDDDELDDEDKPVKKTAHNMIEKRYRTNINDKIAALRDSVPSLRIMSKSARGEDTTGDREELHGLTPAHKLNKATVLSKATEYIRHLEKRNAWLMDENSAMQARIGAFEKLFMAGAMNGSISPMQHPERPVQCCPATQQSFNSPSMDRPQEQDGNAAPAGMIDVPEDMKRIISEQMAVGQPYPVPQQPYRGSNTVCRQQQIQQQQQQIEQSGWPNVSPYIGKLMVGSLAGLMILEAIREDEVSNERPEGRGLFALPTGILKQLASGLDLHVMGYRVHTSLKFLLFLGTFLWIFVPSLFAASETDLKKQRAGTLRPAPSPASPIDVRRRAWLTAIQSVWVPRHNFFLEAAALMLKTIKLSLRNVIGVHGYQMLTGLTQEQEAARVKAWSIALDSQLAGGDVEVCKSRLVLTLLASGTLPDSPIRLMLKALHIRILLWDLGHTRLPLGVVNTIAAKLARCQWNEARQLNRVFAQMRRTTSVESEDELPDYLAALVELECDEVLSSAVIQRAHNLAFNLETTQDVESNIDGMDAVVEDTAIGSPMDAVAAWWSTEFLHIILTATLDEDAQAAGTRAEDLELAVRVTPIGSVAQNRAVLARASLLDKSRGANIAAAIEALKTSEMQSPLECPISVVRLEMCSSKIDFRLALRCATALAHLGRAESTAKGRQAGFRLADSIMTPCDAACMSLLGFTAAMELVERLAKSQPSEDMSGVSLERLSANLRHWMGGTGGSNSGLSPNVRSKVTERCLAITKNLAGSELDTGYGSLSDGDGARH